MLAAVEFQLAGRIGIAGVESDLADCQSRPAELLEMMIRIRASAEADGTALGGTSPKL